MNEEEDKTDNPNGLKGKEIETEILGIKCIQDNHSFTFRLPSEESKDIFRINSLHRKIYNLQGDYTIGLSERMVELIARANQTFSETLSRLQELESLSVRECVVEYECMECKREERNRERQYTHSHIHPHWRALCGEYLSGSQTFR
jgi:hypothetical protein